MMYKLFVVLVRALVSCGDVLLPGLPAMLGSARVAVAREGAQAAVAALVVPAGVALVVPAGVALVVPVGAQQKSAGFHSKPVKVCALPVRIPYPPDTGEWV